ncbi:uncharacterized protein [Trachinotus anak]|uniref:uncharacterized protein isoform X4 n=1 Tax=Trachinotus anak TaxID=443729 RepID=UPI0039F1717A
MATSTQSLLEEDRPVSPAPSYVSMQSDRSKDDPLNFSKEGPGPLEEDRPVSPAPSYVSMQSDQSKDDPLNFSKEGPGLLEEDRPVSPAPSNVSMKSDWSKDEPLNFSKEQPGRPQEQRPESSSSTKRSVQSENDPPQFTREKDELKAHLQKKFLTEYKDEQSQCESHSELYKIKGVTNKDDKGTLVKSYNEIFESSWKKKQTTVLMKGEAGVGKTCQTRMLMIDWAKGESNKDIDLIVPFHFSELNSRRNKDQSIEDLLNHFFNIKQQRAPPYDKYEVVLVLDGLEECQLDLDFKNNKELTDIKEQASMDVLLTNLIKGNLLPSARLWIISRPSGVDKIPPEYIQTVTECRETAKRRQQLVSNLKKRFLREYTLVEDTNHPNQKSTEHIIRKDTEEVNDEEKNEQTESKSVTKVNATSEIFKGEKGQSIRTVLTIGEADIGKSFHVQKFIKEWAGKNTESSVFTWLWSWSKAKDDEELLFPLTFSKLNMIKEEKVSLVGLLNHFFEETKECVISNNAHFKVLFILDGLDASELSLDKSDVLTDVREPASVDVVLTNLIKGNLLPSAQLWITSRPSPAKRLPDNSFDRMTEIRERDAKQELKAHLQKRILTEYKDEQSQREIDTELYKIKGVKNKDNKGTLVKSYDEIFESSWEKKETTVLMKGEAGVGKTSQTRMLMIDWAKGKSNKDIDLIVPFHFSELNSRRDEDQSIEDLLNHFFNIKQRRAPPYDKYKVVFVLDGLEECQLHLDFKNNKELTDIKERASMDVLLTNLIKGNLLPSARLWIISQPSGVDKIPPEYIQTVTECRETAKRRQQLVSNLKKRFLRENTLVEDTNHPNQKNTEHIIRKDTEEVNDEEKNEQTEPNSMIKVNATSEIFKDEKGRSIRTVLTIGEVEIGKSFHVQKFIKEWAGKNTESSFFTWWWSNAKDNEELLFPLTFSELNQIKEEEVSLVGLLNHFFEETKECVISNYANFKVLFILDGLEASELSLDKSDVLTDVREPASVDVVLTNLIKGNLLPSAQLWITSRPSPAKWLPANSFDRITEIREKDAKHELKAHLQKRILTEYKDEQRQCESHTELYKIKGVTNKDDKGTLVKSYNEIFESSCEKKETSVLMMGEAGIGKTCQTRMLMIDWAKEKSNKDIDLIVPFHFSELNSRRGESLSMEYLLNHFFNDIKLQRVPPYDKYKVVLVLDGLEECQLHLDFENNEKLTDIKERASMDVLLTNLIKGNLLPSARLWIISQPSGVDKIPPEYIHTVTECREKDAKDILRAHLQRKFLEDYKDEQSQCETDTELYKIKGVTNKDDKGTLVKSYNDIFKSSWKKKQTTVLMKGEAGVGKTSQTRMLMIDWAKGKSNSDIDLIVPFHFSELNSRRDEDQSIEDLLNHFFNDIKLQSVPTYDKYKVVFVLDGLEECQLDLDFENNKELTDKTELASMDVLLTNLIKRNLLPSARLWIISQPSGVDKIPPEYIQRVTECREKDAKDILRAHLQRKFLEDYKDEQSQCETDTELYKIKGVTNKDDKGTLVKSYNEIFKSSRKQKQTTVLMMGEAGVGKTSQTRMLMIDWAKEKSNKDIDLIVPFHFSELNSRKDEVQSIEDLLNHFFNIKQRRAPPYDKYKVVFVLDGLEECQLHLDFENNKKLTDIKERASMDVLLTNLIKGNLLPSARLWIISQPSGVDKIPPEYIQTVTECRGQDIKPKLRAHVQKRILEDCKDEQSQREIDTELYKIKGVTNKDDKGTLVKSYNEIFESSCEKKQTTVLMKGEAGVGKTSQTRMLMIDWAKGKSNNDIDLMVPFHFSELNSRKNKDQSIEDLLNHFFNIKQRRAPPYDKYKVVFVLDGLEECQLHLDFKKHKKLTDIKELASMDVLLTNLIKGNLLPSARLWIISQPSGVDKIPPEYIHTVTECRDKDVKPKLREHLEKRILEDYKDEQSQRESHSELYVIKDVTNKDDKGTLVKSYNDIFKSLWEKNETTVIMKGVAGIGKTRQTRMLRIDWAKEKSSKDIDLIVPFHFSELNSRRDEHQSIEDLLNHFFNIKQRRAPPYDNYKVVFVLDGLEECQLHLDFENNKELTDIKKRASMDVLLTNLIKGNLLPSARLWIISRPSGVDKIPPEYIQRVTECRETAKRRQQLVSNLKKRFLRENTLVEDTNHPNQKNTEHIIREDTEVNDEEKNEQTESKSATKVNATSEIFKDEKGRSIRTVLTIGEADIGKSFHVQKFIKEWAGKNTESSVLTSVKNLFWGKAKDDEELLFPLTFSKLNMIKEEKVSLVGLLNHFFKETKECVISNYAHFKVLFVLDGLDASELSLDKSDVLTDVREPASVDVVLTNLIKGNLLPSAQLWITSRPSPAKRLPANSFDRMTEIREKPDVTSQRKLKSQLKEQFARVSEGIDKQKTSALLNDIYTDLYIIEGERGEVNAQHESRQVQEAKFKPMREETPIKYQDIFKPASGEKPIRSVLTIGVAGIGKTFASMKYMLDWAEGTENKNIYFTFPLPFRELNLRKDGELSFEELIHQFFPAMRKSEIKNYDKYKTLIVLDGLDECRLDLNVNECMVWTDVRKVTSVNVLLANLIKGNLLPKAQVWITSRPAASNNIPADKVDRVTEVRGFNDDQKEEYFKKRFSDKDLAEKILSHVKKSRSLYIMCHIPVFCWITAKVLEHLFDLLQTKKEKQEEQEEKMPKTLTDMYIHFLLLQCRQANVKYGEEGTSESSDADSCWNTRNKETVLSLGKLAFEELEKGNLLFTEENLTDCDIDIQKTAVFSGLFTQIIREDCGLFQKKFFCFVHLSIQEFLAAFYVTHTFNNKGENLLTESPASDLYKTAVDKALKSKNGDWDLFVRFLLGLSLETNQNLLQEVLKKTENPKKTNKATVEYIKGKINEDISDADKNLNLFHCLNELNDHSLVEEVKKYLKSETMAFENFSASQWSALTFVLLMSDEKLDVFDLKKYLKSEKVLLGMLPVVKVSKTTLLSWCELTEESCKGLTSSVLTSASSNLTKLDLSHNDLLDSGVVALGDGLKSVHCKLEFLKLSGCQVTEEGCSVLASAIKFNAASPLKHLDLSYNHPGGKGAKLLNDIRDDPKTKLQTVCLDHGGAQRLKPGLKKYGADLKFNESTTGKRLVLCDGNRKVKTVRNVEEKVERPETEGRFKRTQVLCEVGLKGVWYWEVEWKGTVGIAVSYGGVGRKWDSSGGLGCNDISWSLLCSKTGYTARHGKMSERIQLSPCQKIAVFLDWVGGSLSYYSVTSGELSLIHTFHAKFTELLFPGFWFKNGSVTLCEID